MKNSSKVSPPANPIPNVLELIPYTESVLDFQIMDAIALALVSTGRIPGITNAAIMVLLGDLHRAELITLSVLNFPNNPGQAYLIQRNL